MAALAPTLGAAALILAGQTPPGSRQALVSRLLSRRPVVIVGLMSYSLYLWHWPILVFLRQVVGAVKLPLSVAAPAMAVAFAAAAASWAFVKRPFRDRGHMCRRRIFTAWLVTSLVIVGLAAAAVLGEASLEARLSPAVRVAIAADRDVNPRREHCLGGSNLGTPCSFGAGGGGPADVLLWGDSHAEALLPGLDGVLAEAGRRGIFTGMGGCPPLVGFHIANLENRRSCARFNEAVIAMLQGRDDVTTVVLNARWAAYAKGQWRDGVLITAQGEHAFEEAVANTLAAIRATGRRVVILGDVPEVGWDVPRKMIAAAR